MIRDITLVAIVCSIALSAQNAKASGVPEDLERIMSWLPADTETITVARGPFVFEGGTLGRNETEDRAVSEKELAWSFEELPLALVQFKNGLLARRLEGKKIDLALQGGRHFRPPSGLGGMPYEGCEIVVFSDNLSNEMTSFTKETRSSALQAGRIENEDVSVFQEKLEQDTWTTFVVFPNDHMILLATERNYLTEVLARLHGKNGERALRSNLLEWKYVNTSARVWGLRHYDKSQARVDPSSPYGGRKSANFHDEQAIGLTFVFDPQSGRTATMTYLSLNPVIATKPGTTALGMANSREAKGLNVKYRELSPGVVEGAYSLENLQAVQFFLLALEGVLGHAIYL